jgi:hypothetical protein
MKHFNVKFHENFYITCGLIREKADRGNGSNIRLQGDAKTIHKGTLNTLVVRKLPFCVTDLPS